MKLDVEPSLTVGMPAADAEPYVGAWAFTEVDSTGARGKTSGFRVLHERGTLKGEFVPKDPYMGCFALIRVAPDLFTVGLYGEKGEIYEVLRPDMMLTFTRSGARASNVEARDDQDRLWAAGARKP